MQPTTTPGRFLLDLASLVFALVLMSTLAIDAAHGAIQASAPANEVQTPENQR